MTGMKLKNTIVRSVVIIVILCLAMLCGLVYQTVWHRIDLKNHPRDFSEYVSGYAAEYGVPEYILYAVIKTESDFESNKLSENGEIGLMQLTPAQFSFICTELLEGDAQDTGLLYEPETNLRAGSAWLSYLFGKYGVWEHVFVAYHYGTEATDAWLADPTHLSARGELLAFPTRECEDYAKRTAEAVETYNQLYYQA